MATVVELAPQPERQEQGDENRERPRVAFSGVPTDQRVGPATSASLMAPVKREKLLCLSAS